jgi:cysteinyl-tRNA synthetase
LDGAAIDSLIEARKQARANREFAKADEIRDQLTSTGIILEDSADGTIWRRR